MASSGSGCWRTRAVQYRLDYDLWTAACELSCEYCNSPTGKGNSLTGEGNLPTDEGNSPTGK
eukprot:3267332-Pyramimonas_sp.AAC.1